MIVIVSRPAQDRSLCFYSERFIELVKTVFTNVFFVFYHFLLIGVAGSCVFTSGNIPKFDKLEVYLNCFHCAFNLFLFFCESNYMKKLFSTISLHLFNRFFIKLWGAKQLQLDLNVFKKNNLRACMF